MEKKRLRLDILVIGALLLVSLAFVGISLALRQGGSYAAVEIDGTRVAEYPLSVNATYPLGNGSNTLVIENGYAYMSDADCPDKTCVSTGKVRYVGQSIICLPNRIAVIIEGESDGVDLVS